jgi:hypothetical protein
VTNTGTAASTETTGTGLPVVPHWINGADGVEFFTQRKAITSRWPEPSHGGIDLGFPGND